MAVEEHKSKGGPLKIEGNLEIYAGMTNNQSSKESMPVSLWYIQQ